MHGPLFSPHFSPVALSPQESEGISCHYWSLFDGHAGSGAAVVASRLLQHHITQQLQEIVEILKNSAILPPTCLGEEPESTPAHGRTLTRAASLRGGVGAPGSPSTPPTRFFTEKKIPHECLVIGALESAFKEMVCTVDNWGSSSQSFLASKVSLKCPCSSWLLPHAHLSYTTRLIKKSQQDTVSGAIASQQKLRPRERTNTGMPSAY